MGLKEIDVFLFSYNNERYVEKAILSVILQSEVKVNLVVIDDFSTDDSRSIIESLRLEFGFDVIYNVENKGLMHNVNLALKMIKSEFFTLHSSDDISRKGRFSFEISCLSTHVDCAFIVSEMAIIGKRQAFDESSDLNKFSLQDIFDLKVKTNISCTYRSVYLKDLLLNTSYISEEPQIFYKVLDKSNREFIKSNLILYDYRINENGLSSTKMLTMLEQNLELLALYQNGYNVSRMKKLIIFQKLLVLIDTNRFLSLMDFFNNFFNIGVKYKVLFLGKFFLPKSLKNKLKVYFVTHV
jgi:glycosyltransferase involved in cell wall biosynthesis